MRILFLTQWFDPEPSPIASMALVRSLRDQGHEVHIITGFPNYPDGKFYDGYRVRPIDRRQVEPGITLARVALVPSHDRSVLRRFLTYSSFALTAMLALPRHEEFDVIYAYQGQSTIGFPALLAKRRYKAPVVLHVQDFWPDTVLSSGFLPTKVEKVVDRPLRAACSALYRNADRTIGLSPGMTQLLISHGASPAQADTIVNWAEEEIFLPPVWSAPPESDVCTVLYAGNLGPFQRVDLAMEAAARAHETNPKLRLRIIGTGSEEARIRELASRLGSPAISVEGKRPYSEMGQLNHEADALLVCLADLDFFTGIIPSKCQVALAAGRPVIGALSGDARDLLDESGGAITCAPGDVDGMTQAFVKLADMGAEGRMGLGRASRTYYDSKLSFSSGAQAIERSLRKAVEATSQG